jgi:cysteate synthase
MYSVNNVAAEAGSALFQELEGIDLEPAAAVATAALMEAVESGRIRTTDTVMLNVTGGGIERLRREQTTRQIEPDLVLGREIWKPEDLGRLMERIR